jgi:hypothetical protein
MTDGRGVLREIAWRELFPWLILLRTFRLAIQPSILGIALLAAFLTPLGWRVARAMFRIPDSAVNVQPDRLNELQLAHSARILGRFPGTQRDHAADVGFRVQNPGTTFWEHSPIPFTFARLTGPMLQLYQSHIGVRGFAFYLVGMIWTLAVWSFAGGVITRIAAVELGREETASVTMAVRVTIRRWFDLFTAPLYPILGTFLIALLLTPLGWLLWSSDVGTILAGLLWIFAVLGGLLSALLLLWVFVGWPLMWPAITVEETGDSFEAMSRSYSYAFQRPLHYLFYALVAAVLGFIAWLFIDFLVYLALQAAHWSVSWGSGSNRLQDVLTGGADPTRPLPFRLGSDLIRWTEGMLLALSEAFGYSYFWVSATAMYLLLRQNVDRMEFDEVWLADETPRYPLPPTAAESAPAGAAITEVPSVPTTDGTTE